MTEEEALRELRSLVASVLFQQLTDDFIDRCGDSKRRSVTLQQLIAEWRGNSGRSVLWDESYK
jgi:hypothetical protein